MEEEKDIKENQIQEVDTEEPLILELPGTYYIDENGGYHKATNWQNAIDRIKWEDATNLIESLTKRGASERITNLWGMYILVAVIIIIAGILSFNEIIEGQAIAGFLGAAIGYLLSRANIR